MSAKAVTGDEGAAREAVLRAMQEAAESAAGKNGVPKGPNGTRGIMVLPTDVSWTSPEDDKKKKKKRNPFLPRLLVYSQALRLIT